MARKRKRELRRRDEIARRSLPPEKKRFRATDTSALNRRRRSKNGSTSMLSGIRAYRPPSFHNVNLGRTFSRARALPGYGLLVVPQTSGTRVSKVRSPGICERRRERSEVINALGHAGKRGQKRPVWTQKSKMRCK